MNPQGLASTAAALLAHGEGLLAMDESNPTCNARFAHLGIPRTLESRLAEYSLLGARFARWRAVPAAVPAITVLSGGQSGELASARLNAMNVRFPSAPGWQLSFSFDRALQQPGLEIWRGQEARIPAAVRSVASRASQPGGRRWRSRPRDGDAVNAPPTGALPADEDGTRARARALYGALTD